jgi:phage terminase large subunit-like protein
VRAEAARGARRLALVAPTLHDAREVMIDGPSGLRAVAASHERPAYTPSRRRLEWPNGALGYVFSAEDPDSLRGPQFDRAWCDELAAWPLGQQVWDTLALGLRLGERPRAAVTTTPRPTALIEALRTAPDTVVSQAGTAANAAFLADGFVAEMLARYGGTRLGRQELEGEVLEAAEGALWTARGLLACRWEGPLPELVDVVVGVDPPAGVGPEADACGIVAAGRDRSGGLWVLADASARGLAPLDWAGRVAALASRWPFARVVAEANQGGAMVATVLNLAGLTAPVELAHARLSKRARAEPVAARYARGEVRHAGRFAGLEDEMLRFGASPDSPDRVDALVWALSVLTEGVEPRVRRL